MNFKLDGRVVGTNPRPRLLVVRADASVHERLSSGLSDAIPTLRFIRGLSAETAVLRSEEWDAVVSFGDDLAEMSDLPQIVFSDQAHFGRVTRRASSNSDMVTHSTVMLHMGSIGRELHVPSALPNPIRQAIESDVLPLYHGTEQRKCLSFASGHQPITVDDGVVTPFLTDLDGKIMCGVLHHANYGDIWFLPSGCDYERWIRLAFDAWSSTSPVKYSLRDGWKLQARWMTAPEVSVADELESLESERARFDIYYEKRRQDLEAERSRARRDADSTARRLLHSQDDDLVEAVSNALSQLGFRVQLMDPKNAPKGAKLEDLRVHFDSEPDWQCLAEVRGYKAGARTDDLLRISGFVTRYVRENGRTPSAVWYIVNQFIFDPPDRRPEALSARREEREEFASQDGCIIDTRDLFQLTCDLSVGAIESEEAREMLINARGLFSYEARR